MNEYKNYNILHLLYLLFIRFFNNKIIIMTLDLFMTTLVSIHTSQINLKDPKWRRQLIIYIIILILIHAASIICEKIVEENRKYKDIVCKTYKIQNKFYNKTATSLYRVNKKIHKSMNESNIQDKELKSIYNFQESCFMICKELCNMITSEFGCEDCEVTIFQRFDKSDSEKSEYVKMIAYKNNKSTLPSSYSEIFKLNGYKKNIPFFISMFKDLNAETVVLCTPEEVASNFYFFENSKIRESKICQYICVPIKTNRDKIELILQIDVSKKNCFGKKYKDVKAFADEVISPFANIIHCNYEQDLLLTKYYTVLGVIQKAANEGRAKYKYKGSCHAKKQKETELQDKKEV